MVLNIDIMGKVRLVKIKRDINGSWCYVDTLGNYEYCGEYEPSCMNLDILDTNFIPDPEGYQIVISNSQPFPEPYLELDKIVDSANQIWCLDKMGRFLRYANKSGFVNYQWENLITDSLSKYDPSIESSYFISGFGVKMGGYPEKKSNSDVKSLGCFRKMLSFFKNTSNDSNNKILKCTTDTPIHLQDTKKHIPVSCKGEDYLVLDKKIMIDDKGKLKFGINKKY